MEETQNHMQSTDNGEQHGTPITRLRLPDLPDFRLGIEGDLNAFDATDSEFLQFVQSLVPVTGEHLDHWTWEERRDFLNWCLDEQILTIQDGRLVPVEEQVVTVPLSEHNEAVSTVTEDAPDSTEDDGFLHDVERAAPVLHANPEISANELADTLGLKSTVYAQTLKVFVNVHHDEEGGTEECSHG
jgi:hypothetical protein